MHMTALISISVKTRFLHSAKFDMFIEFDMHLNSLLTKVSKKERKKGFFILLKIQYFLSGNNFLISSVLIRSTHHHTNMQSHAQLQIHLHT